MLRDIGKRDKRVTFEQRVETPNDSGGVSIVWTSRFGRWVAVAIPNLGAALEAIAGGAVESSMNATITLPADPETRTITTNWRVSMMGRLWNIRAISPEDDGDLRMAIESGGPT